VDETRQDSENDPDVQWARISSELAAYRRQRRESWGNLDDLTLARYLAGEATNAEAERVRLAMDQHPKVRDCVAILREVAVETAAVAEPVGAPNIRISSDESTRRPVQKRRFVLINAAVAASLLLVCSLAGLTYVGLKRGESVSRIVADAKPINVRVDGMLKKHGLKLVVSTSFPFADGSVSFKGEDSTVILLAESDVTKQVRDVKALSDAWLMAISRKKDLERTNPAYQSQEADTTLREEIEALISRRRESYAQSVLALRELVNKTLEQYAELGADEDVKEVIGELRQTGNAAVELGPSRELLTSIEPLEQIEKSMTTERLDLRKEGENYLLNVTFNGNVTKPAVFDPDAKLTLIPASLDGEIKLGEVRGARVVRPRQGTGSMTADELKVVPSMKVGSLAVKNVDCAVTAANKSGLSPVLGHSFFRDLTYTYRLGSDGGQLLVATLDELQPWPGSSDSAAEVEPALPPSSGTHKSGDQ
jgi:hypothetical protein